MDDLISRAAAKFQACNWNVKPNAVIYEGIKEAIKSQLDMAPAVDAAPVVHARWKSYCVPHWTKRSDDNGDPEYKYHDEHVCSACGRRTVIKENFCPKCGAKMDGERRDSE